MLPLISIVIPAYNLETRIKKTLECVMEQDYVNTEIIVVDDASSDNTLDIVRKIFKGTNKACRVITSKVNSGVSVARNLGIEAASGEFMLFWDGDDLADKNFISTLFETISANKDCDIAFCGYRTLEEKSGIEKKYPISMSAASGKTPQQIAALRILNKVTPSICSVLYRSSYIKSIGLRFSDGCTAGEDVEFVIKSLVRCRQLSSSAKTCYIYMQHETNSLRKNYESASKRLVRYKHNTYAHKRTVDYIQSYSTDNELKFIAKFMLVPETILRILSVNAAENNIDAFNERLTDKDTRKLLWSSYKSLPYKTEIFPRALSALLMPDIYFKHYKNRFLQYGK